MNIFEWHKNFINNYPLISLSYYLLIGLVFKNKYFPSWKNIKSLNTDSNLFIGIMWLSIVIFCIIVLFNKGESLNIGFTGQIYFLLTIFMWIELFYNKIKQSFTKNNEITLNDIKQNLNNILTDEDNQIIDELSKQELNEATNKKDWFERYIDFLKPHIEGGIIFWISIIFVLISIIILIYVLYLIKFGA